MLTEEQSSFFESEGYLVLEGFASAGDIETLRQRADELLANYDPAEVSLFSTTSREKIKSNYLVESAATVAFFLEEGAVDENGQLKYDKALAVNKVGHALHDVDPSFRSFSRSEKICELLKSLNYKRPIPVQSMYICKQPSIGGKVVPHQDDSFLYTEPPSVVGAWLALEDATVENGCLFILPKSHKGGLRTRYGRTSEGPLQLIEGDEDPQWDLSQFTALPAKAGTLVLLHGSVVHFSHENTSEKSRHAYTVHYIESAEGYTWTEDNWLQRPPDFPFEHLYSA